MPSFRRGRPFSHMYLFNVCNDSTNFATSRLGHLHQFFTKDSWMEWSISYNSSPNTLGCQDMTATTLMLELMPNCSKRVPPPIYTRSGDMIMLKSTISMRSLYFGSTWPRCLSRMALRGDPLEEEWWDTPALREKLIASPSLLPTKSDLLVETTKDQNRLHQY